MRHESFFFSPSPAQKKNNHHHKSAFKRAPVSRAKRAPVSRASCVRHESFFPFSRPSQKKKKIATHKCVQTSPRVSRRTSPRVSCIVICMRHGSFFFPPCPLPKKKIIIIAKVRSNEPPCLTQNEPPCLVHHHMHASRIFFFSPLSPAQKKINHHHRKSAFKRAPVSHAERAPVSRASSYACVTDLFFFPPVPCPKKNK